MKKKSNKKAQASVLVIILGIVFVLTLIVVVWNITNSSINKNSEKIKISALNINLDIKEIILSSTGAGKVKIERGAGEGEITSLKFIFYDENGLSESEVKNGDLKELETRTYYFSPFPNLGKIKQVSIVPFINQETGREFKSHSEVISKFPEGLVSWWRFEDNNDLLNKNNGQMVNAQLDNGSLVLNGNGYFDAGNDASLNSDAEFSASAWIELNNYRGEIISKGNTNKNYAISVNEDGAIRFIYGNGEYLETLKKIPLNKKTHIAVSIDWKGIWMIFIDGNLQKTDAKTIEPSINSENLYIGEEMNGKIDDLMLFNKILSSENIEFLYKNQLD